MSSGKTPEGEERYGLIPLVDKEDLDRVLQAPLVLIYKHSPICGLSSGAVKEVRWFKGEHPSVSTYFVDVVGNRKTSDEIERRTEQVIAFPRERTGSASEAAREFERALELEDADPLAACTAYGRALELDPDLVDAYVNLGRIAHEAGRGLEAIRLYELALERTPEDPVLHFNLALAVDDARGPAAAARHYERALELAPDFADAHYNFAALCEKLDRPRDALRHYSAYKRLTSAD